VRANDTCEIRVTPRERACCPVQIGRSQHLPPAEIELRATSIEINLALTRIIDEWRCGVRARDSRARSRSSRRPDKRCS
jgi:hypothetical protein